MSRFIQEVEGKLGEYWRNSALKEVEKARKQFEEDAYVVDGVCRWKSNNRVIMDDMAEKMEYAGCDFSREATRIARQEEVSNSLREYRRNSKEVSNEEMNEMRSAFGKGTKVVNIITGKVIQL